MRINLLKRTVPRIGELNKRLIICTTIERPDEDVSTIVERPGVFRVHGRVRAIKGEEVLAWKGVFDTAQVPTQEVTIRVPPDVHLDIGHWVFVSDRYRESWLKVRTIDDLGGAHRFVVLLCTIETLRDRRSDPATQSMPPVFERPTMSEAAPFDDGY